MYKLVVEQKGERSSTLPQKKPKRKLDKQISPLRYPGGKSKLVDYVYQEMPTDTKTIISPFAGGASVELSLLQAGLCDQLILNDTDPHLINFYNACLTDSAALKRYVTSESLSQTLYEEAHAYAINDFAHISGEQNTYQAFLYLLNNRCSFSGIYKAGRIGGKNGTIDQLGVRWNPEAIINRIEKIEKMAHRIVVHQQDFADLIKTYNNKAHALFIIDPPYVTQEAKKLYRSSFTSEQHAQLFDLLNKSKQENPDANFLVFYDDHPDLYQFALPNDIEKITRRYSIAKQTRKD